MKFASVLLAAAAVLGVSPVASTADAKDGAIRVAVYRGYASCDNCSETVKSAIENIDSRYRVDFVGPGERIDISTESLAGYDIYVQPGGGQDIPGALNSLGDDRVAAIQSYVAHGGRYLGLCMGAYLADASNIGLIPHDLDSEVGRPGFPVKTIDDEAVAVRWDGRRESVFFQDGPYLWPASGDAGFREIARYENGDLAAARYSHGKGLVVLTGPHPEADEAWFEDADIPLDKMPSRDLIKGLLSQLGV